MSDVFDKDELLEEIDGDREFLVESLEMFEEDAPRLLVEIRDGLNRRDAQAVGKCAHTLKSMVGNFCAQPAFDCAFKIESFGRQGDLNGVADTLGELEERVNQLRAALQEFSAQL